MKDEDAVFKTNIKGTHLQAYKFQVFAKKETEVAAEPHRIDRKREKGDDRKLQIY